MSDPHGSLVGMSFWADIAGQPAAAAVLERAASPEGASELAHAWLVTGPPGSGRSNIALRFAAALIAREAADRDAVYAQVRARTHPDITVLTTQKLIIGIDDVRDILTTAHYAPAEGRHRVIVIEDADRMPERTSNLLLKAIEEPPERTVWVLCAPSEADLLPTIRSRCRSLRLATPSVDAVAHLLQQRDGVVPEEAERAARLAQSHIGMARRLATDPEALARRERTLDIAFGVATLGDAMQAAAALTKVAEDDAEAMTSEVDAREREEALRGLGIEAGAAIPPALRAQIRALEEDQKRRAKRSLRDGIDRVLTDLLSLFRDVLLVSLGSETPLINAERAEGIAQLAEGWGPERALAVVEAVERARERLERGVTPSLVLEALFASLVAPERESTLAAMRRSGVGGAA